MIVVDNSRRIYNSESIGTRNRMRLQILGEFRYSYRYNTCELYFYNYNNTYHSGRLQYYFEKTL